MNQPEFPTVFRGYDPDQVDRRLAAADQDTEAARQEAAQLSVELTKTRQAHDALAAEVERQERVVADLDLSEHPDQLADVALHRPGGRVGREPAPLHVVVHRRVPQHREADRRRRGRAVAFHPARDGLVDLSDRNARRCRARGLELGGLVREGPLLAPQLGDLRAQGLELERGDPHRLGGARRGGEGELRAGVPGARADDQGTRDQGSGVHRGSLGRSTISCERTWFGDASSTAS